MRQIAFFIFLATALLANTRLQAPEPVANNRVELVNSDDYSVKRFQEVIAAYIENEPPDAQSAVIDLRAKLSLAEKRLEELMLSSGIDSPNRDPVKPSTIRAAHAEVDHYRKKIDGFEAEILKQRRKESENKKKK